VNKVEGIRGAKATTLRKVRLCAMGKEDEVKDVDEQARAVRERHGAELFFKKPFFIV